MRLGLRVLSVLLLLAGMVPATVLIVIEGRQNLAHVRAAARSEVGSIARLVAQRHQSAVDTARGTLLATARLPSVRRLAPRACAEELAAIAAASDLWANLGVSALDGRTICSAPPLRRAVNVADRAFFKGALATGGFASGTRVVTSLGQPDAIAFGLPVRDGAGKVVAVASAALRLDALLRRLEELELPASVAVVVIDRNGEMISALGGASGGAAFGPEVVRRAMSGEHLHEGPGGDGVRRVFGFESIEAEGAPAMWAVAAMPTAQVEAPVRALSRRTLGTWGLAMLAIAAWTGFVAERLLLRRFHALSRAAARIAAGDYKARTGLPPRADELGELVAAFDDMARSLETLERQNRLLLDSIGDGILGLDREARVVFANPAASRLLGLAPEQLKGSPFAGLFRSAAPGGDPFHVRQSLEDGRVHVASDDGFTRRDGGVVPVESVTTPLVDEGRIVGAVIALRDATERRKLEDQLRQAQKMEAVGQLAGGVAHDFNNLLTAIITCGRMVQESLAPNHPAQPDVAEILSSGDRAAQLTRQLLAFARRQRLAPRPIDLRESVGGTERMLRRVLGETISLTVELGPEPLVIHADPGQIELVVLNLAVNARDAMPGGGELTIAVERAASQEEADGPMAQLAVRDTGVGMDEDTQDRIFEPFFTTKPTGQGTGLGLATVYGIVKQSEGAIRVRSGRGRGTEFRVLFPLRAGAPAAALAAPGRAVGGSERVLVLEDDDVLRTLVCRALAGVGYRVVEAPRPSVAVALAEEGDLDLLVTDLVLPEQSGWQLYRELAARRPRLRLLIMSGFASEPVPGLASLPPDVPFIAKPFAPHDLLAKVRMALDGPPPVD